MDGQQTLQGIRERMWKIQAKNERRVDIWDNREY